MWLEFVQKILPTERRTRELFGPKYFNGSEPGGALSRRLGRPLRGGGQESGYVGLLSKCLIFDSVYRSVTFSASSYIGEFLGAVKK